MKLSGAEKSTLVKGELLNIIVYPESLEMRRFEKIRACRFLRKPRKTGAEGLKRQGLSRTSLSKLDRTL